ncbi:MAG: hypothetical protein ABI824_03535 [Acidobacteriota bacterium]
MWRGTFLPTNLAASTIPAMPLSRSTILWRIVSFISSVSVVRSTTRPAASPSIPGAAYITGDGSYDFPVTLPQATQPKVNTYVAFAAKLDPTGNIVYVTTFAGASAGSGRGIAVNGVGEAFVTGVVQTTTGNPPFPATPGAAVNLDNAAYLAKLDANGNLLFVNRGIGGIAVDVDAQGNVFAVGQFAPGTDPPVTPGAFQTTHGSAICSSNQLFTTVCPYQHIAKLDSSGQTLLFGTFLAGKNGARPKSILADPSGAVYLTGSTASSDYPITDGAVRPTFPPVPPSIVFPGFSLQEMGFLSKLKADGSGVLFSTYLGGSLTDLVGGLALHDGQLYASAYTQSTSFPGAENVSSHCLPAIVLFRVSQDGKSVDQLHGHPLSPAEVTKSGYQIGVALDIQGSAFSILAGTGIYRITPTDSQALSCATDAATFNITHTVAPGQILSIFGSGLAPGTAAANPTLGGQLPVSLGNLSVDVDGIAASLLYASPDQLNVVVPYEVAGKSQVTMTATAKSFLGASIVVASDSLQVTARNPSVFLSPDAVRNCGSVTLVASNEPIALARNQDGSLNTCSTPAAPGSVITLYLNGAGLASAKLDTGKISTQATPTGVPVTAYLNSPAQTPFDVVNVSLEPGSVSSVWRADIRIPASLSGRSAWNMVLKVDGNSLPGPYLVIWTMP